MCQRLRDLQQSVTTYAGTFDSHALTPAQAGEVVRLCSRVEASIASVKALAAARSAESNDWQLDGYRSPADQLAHQAGISPAAAKRTLSTGSRLAAQPEVATAALAGELSLEQAAAVTAGAAANPSRTQDLITKAQSGSLPELHEEVARIKATACDQQARHAAQHTRRSLRRWTDLDGALQAHLSGVPEDGARLWRMLDPIRRRLNILRRESTTPNERLDALDYDALMLMADIAAGKDAELAFADLRDLGLFPQFATFTAHLNPAATTTADLPTTPTGPLPTAADSPTTAADPAESALFPATPTGPPDTRPKRGRRRKKLAGSPARIMIRVDLDTLLRGVPLDGELCEMVGYGPIPVSVIESILATDNPFIIGILTKAKAVVGVYHHGRHPNAHQRSALDFAYPTCAAQGCSAKDGLQYDHRIDWNDTGYTVYDLLDRLCPHHHRLKTQRNWALVDGTGKRPFVPPDDPRHPRNSGDAPMATANSP